MLDRTTIAGTNDCTYNHSLYAMFPLDLAPYAKSEVLKNTTYNALTQLYIRQLAARDPPILEERAIDPLG